jgi:hypothetical protein
MVAEPLTDAERDRRERVYEERLEASRRFRAFESDRAEVWLLAEAEDARLAARGLRLIGETTALIPRWRPPVDDLEQALAIAEWC